MLVTGIAAADVPEAPDKALVDYINPFIGAGSTGVPSARTVELGLDPRFTGFHGKTFPGAATPGGMIQLSPDTITGGDNGSGYSYPHTTIQGFSFTHMSGVGAYGDLGNFMVMPTSGPLKTYWGETDHPGSGYLSAYNKASETAQAGYYAVTLDDYKVKAEMTAAPHSGILRFTFSENPLSRIQVDLARRVGGISLHQTVHVVGDHAIGGQIECPREGGGFRHGSVGYTVYYYAEFSVPLKTYGVWSATLPPGPYREILGKPAFAEACRAASVLPGYHDQEGEHLGFYVEFPTHAGETVLVKAGMSYVSVEGARQNLAAEIPAWDFDGARRQSRSAWDAALQRLAVEGGTESEKTIYYTALYHALLDPRIYADVNGDYLGGDNRVHRAQGFTKRTVFSGWDVYRSEFPLLTLIAPGIVNDQINSVVELAEQNGTGYYDRWEMMNCYSGCMDGNPQIAVINDAYEKGIRGYNIAKAYQFAVNTSEHFGSGPRGYDPSSYGVSITMENAYDDWNLSQLARKLGRADATKYATQAEAYTQLFDPAAPWIYGKGELTTKPEWKGWFHLKDADGQWLPWEGLTSGKGGMEASLYQQGWAAPHDIPRLIELLGGRDAFVAKLSDFFERCVDLRKNNHFENQSNEPSHLIPFLFNRAGAPWLTQKWVRKLVTETYGASPNGLCGDDDVGQMSAWYVLAASGLHQACPGDSRFEIFSPLFKRVTLHTDPKYASGGTFTISAADNSPANVYIQSARLNGVALDRCWLDYSEIVRGGTLDLVLGPEPNRKWGLAQR